MTMKFIGIDLGWRSQPSGLCCLEWIDGQLELLDLDRKDAIADILIWIDQSVQADEPAIIAVDAPTLIPNTTGSRLPDKLSHKYFDIMRDATQLIKTYPSQSAPSTLA